jgi:hypothetical protein
VSIADELQAAAAEELVRACTISWRELTRVVPWGDTFEGVAPSGREVEFERRYLWAVEPGGDVLVEVEVRVPGRPGDEARVSRVIAREG